MKNFKKIISIALATIIAITGLIGGSSLIANSLDAYTTLIENSGPYYDDAYYIKTYNREVYYQYTAFEIKFKYDYVGTPSEPQYDEPYLGYNDTFEFLVFDTVWSGWQKTTVGPSGVDKTSNVVPKEDTIYTATVFINKIENKLEDWESPYGINIQTGGIGTSVVSIVSLRLVSGTVPYVQQPFNIECEWSKDFGANFITIDNPKAATIYVNEWYIEVSAIDLSKWINPTVEVTATYYEPCKNAQAEIAIVKTGNYGEQEYEGIDSKYVDAEAGTYTYTTEIPNTTTKFIACYDKCIVTKIMVYDNTAGNTEYPVSGQTATTIKDNMGLAWNLGNALECVDENGEVNEKAWGNPKTTKKLIQAVKAAGFNTVKIPVSFMSMISEDGTVNDEYIARIQQVVNYAYDMGMYSIVSLHGDGMPSVKGSWINIDATGTEFDTILNKYGALWTDIAQAFIGYDQKVLFQAGNEFMNNAGDYIAAPTQTEYDNINALDQTFVNAVRNAGGDNNFDRVLLVVGYNSNIDWTVEGFKKPTEPTADRLILSVNYYDPTTFTLGNDSRNPNDVIWDEYGQYGTSWMDNQFAKITNFTNGLGMPVMIGEYAPEFKNNLNQITNYDYWLNYYASLYGIVAAYWDNGVTGELGTGLFDRSNNVITEEGKVIVTSIIAGNNLNENPNYY